MSTHYCPVETCGFGDDEPRSYRSVRSHINASSDADHVWPELKPLVEQQRDEEPESNEEQSEAVDNAASEQDTEGPEEGSMPTKEEYDQQSTDESDETSTPEAGEKDAQSSDSESNTGSGSSTASGAGIPLGNRTFLVLVAVVVLAAAGYYLYLDNGADSNASAKGSPSTPSEGDEAPTEDGGLWE